MKIDEDKINKLDYLWKDFKENYEEIKELIGKDVKEYIIKNYKDSARFFTEYPEFDLGVINNFKFEQGLQDIINVTWSAEKWQKGKSEVLYSKKEKKLYVTPECKYWDIL